MIFENQIRIHNPRYTSWNGRYLRGTGIISDLSAKEDPDLSMFENQDPQPWVYQLELKMYERRKGPYQNFLKKMDPDLSSFKKPDPQPWL